MAEVRSELVVWRNQMTEEVNELKNQMLCNDVNTREMWDFLAEVREYMGVGKKKKKGEEKEGQNSNSELPNEKTETHPRKLELPIFDSDTFKSMGWEKKRR